jgi:hypothetical protein
VSAFCFEFFWERRIPTVATHIERVWARIKRTAHEYAKSNRFPNGRLAETIVLAIMRDEGMEAPVPEAVELLAREFSKLIADDEGGFRLRRAS